MGRLGARLRRTGGTRAVRTAAVAIALVAAALVGCSAAPAPSAKERVTGTIIRYDRLLAEGYRSMDMSRIRQVANELQSEDEYIHMSSLGEGGVRLLPYLKHFEFLSVNVDGSAAHAQTRETWDFRHESVATHKVVLVQKDLIYDVAWDLARQPDGRWLVTDARVPYSTSTVEPSRLGTATPGSGHF